MITKTCYLILLFLIFLCVCLYKHKCCSQWLEMMYIPGAGITHGCELPDVGPGN